MMLLIYDFLSLVVGSIAILASHPSEFIGASSVAVILAGIGWYGAANYSKLWNLQFRTTATHAVLCFTAALLTFVFVMLYASFKYTQDAAEVSIGRWSYISKVDKRWQNSARQRAFDEIKSAGLEDFSKVPSTFTPDAEIPLKNTESRTKYAEVIAAAAIDDFKANRPFLSKIVWVRAAVPRQTVEAIEKRISQFFESGENLLPAEKVVAFSADALREPLNEGAARMVPVFRGIIVALFFLVQLVPFGLIGWAAWRDLKVTV
jgi:hypothetical protein